MIVYADAIGFADEVIQRASQPWTSPSVQVTDVLNLCGSLYQGNRFRQSSLESDLLWKYLFLVEHAPRSHYDLLIELARRDSALPDGVLCLAGSGDKFHGFKNRQWSASPGNVHLSAYLAPARPIAQHGVGFTILAAVSVIDATDSIPGLKTRAAIKWVNDIQMEGSKVCGVVAYTQTANGTVSAAVIGIGLNVETKPSVEPTPFVPRVASLRDFASDPSAITQGLAFDRLIRAMDNNYRLLLEGKNRTLLDRYRERSMILGRKVSIRLDDAGFESEIIASGRVRDIGESLELYLEGVSRPVWKGRLVLEDEEGDK
jgi:BirA family biotin operon repressor/biotin-[acetyl-CoA-carboxylase] ligase